MAQEVYPTKHALEQMSNREVTWGEIVDVVNAPEVIYGPDERGRKTYQRGQLCIVVGGDGAVVTVLLRQVERWDDGQARQRGGPDLA